MEHNAGIQLYGSNKPRIPQMESTDTKWDKKKEKKEFWNGWSGKKTMKERKEMLLKKKSFLDRNTVKYLEDIGLLKTDKTKREMEILKEKAKTIVKNRTNTSD